ncbi:DUF6708 domain-containing protein [Chromobacterium rhizoryzae]|uniref:DUF6708 domain-containing protein n=1 Tax=Chromobacterium rhizoryzae TaxID=1778675 RepID=UPI001D073B8A|nr:DUF6708 domain-containing protein [Chromobacterium rhizoryzae]
MEYTGLYQKYTINRPLTRLEQEHGLDIHQKLDLPLAYQLAVIKINSTYLELVDKYFRWKGVMSSVLLAIFYIVPIGCATIALDFILIAIGANSSPYYSPQQAWTQTVLLLLFGPGLIGSILIWLLRKEAFALTHYPIRLNRKSRKIFAFQPGGKIVEFDWDHSFFCLGLGKSNTWEIQGHKLDAEGKVSATFAFSELAVGAKDRELLKQHWEFIRRYMEEGPTSVIQEVKACLPIADQREPFWFGLQRTAFYVSAMPWSMRLAFLLIYLICYPGRWLAMRTSQVPAWPANVDEQCQVAPDDPYSRDASMNP